MRHGATLLSNLPLQVPPHVEPESPPSSPGWRIRCEWRSAASRLAWQTARSLTARRWRDSAIPGARSGDRCNAPVLAQRAGSRGRRNSRRRCSKRSTSSIRTDRSARSLGEGCLLHELSADAVEALLAAAGPDRHPPDHGRGSPDGWRTGSPSPKCPTPSPDARVPTRCWALEVLMPGQGELGREWASR